MSRMPENESHGVDGGNYRLDRRFKWFYMGISPELTGQRGRVEIGIIGRLQLALGGIEDDVTAIGWRRSRSWGGSRVRRDGGWRVRPDGGGKRVWSNGGWWRWRRVGTWQLSTHQTEPAGI